MPKGSAFAQLLMRRWGGEIRGSASVNVGRRFVLSVVDVRVEMRLSNRI